MDILNQLTPRRYRAVDDLLAFISIYDDDRRTRAYRRLLALHRTAIRGSVCVEGGAGLALFSMAMARLGARKVYAVEQNRILTEIARQRIDRLPRPLAAKIELVNEPLQSFRPPEKVDILLHELYGQLLYDEDLDVLGRLRFHPSRVIPDGGELRAGVVHSAAYRDPHVTPDVVRLLDGILVAGLFEERLNELTFPVLRWNAAQGLRRIPVSLKNREGDLLVFGLAVTDRGRILCEAARCPNWSYVWTSRAGDRFDLRFRRDGDFMNVNFRWL
jgi:hypothetical protein